MQEALTDSLTEIAAWSYGYAWVLATLFVAFVIASLVYWSRARKVEQRIYLAPVSVRGGLSEELGSPEAGLLLLAHLDAIPKSFNRDRSSPSALYTAEAVGDAFRSVHAALASTPLDLGASEIKLSNELVIAVGTVKIPLGALFNLFKSLIRILPAWKRRAYLDSVIHVALVSSGEHTQLLVHRGSRKVAERPAEEKAGGPSQNRTGRALVLARTRSVSDLMGMSALLREAAFDVLELHGQAFPGRNGQSMRYFADGLGQMDEYRRTGEPEVLSLAEDSFRQSVAADPDHHEALYFYGSLLWLKRTRESIAHARTLFQRAIEAPQGKLRALAHAGLAFCYAQQFHRLAMRGTGVTEDAQTEIRRAEEHWRTATGGEPLHPWILLVHAVVLVVDEGTEETRAEAQQRFLQAAALYLEGLRREPESGTFHNNLGWVLLKLAEWGVRNLQSIEGAPDELDGDPAELAEKHFLQSLGRSPKNKLIYANLCLLYATPRFRDKGHLDECRFHGLMAIQLDPDYINGHRDLALSLVRYDRLDEAYEYFVEALRLADTIAKDKELIADATRVLHEMGVRNRELRRWMRPDRRLLLPVRPKSEPSRGSKAEDTDHPTQG